MGDISAISAGRAAALRNEARFQRDQQTQTRVRLEEENRIASQRQAGAVQDQASARARRLGDSIADRRQFETERRDIDSENRAVADNIRDRRNFARQHDVNQARLEAQARDADAQRPRLIPRTPVTDISEGRFQEEIPPLGPPPEPANAVPTAEDLALARQGPLAAFEPLADPFAPPEEALAPPSLAPIIQERERAIRVSERQEDARTLNIEQNVESQLADQRLTRTTQANPNLPRGSIVNVLG